MDLDLIVIGSGPGGYKAAVTAAHHGARVGLIERDQPGGTCLNQGCIPKKTLLYLAGLIEDVNALNGHGLCGTTHGDFTAALAHKDRVVANIRDNFPIWLKRLGVRVYHGHARFLDAQRVAVTCGADDTAPTEVLRAPRIIVATGAHPREHSVCRSDGEHILTSRDFMLRQHDLPESVLCLGGGPIGVEFAYLMHQFGAKATIAEHTERLLNKPCIPERASTLIERKFRRLGIEVMKQVSVGGVERSAAGLEVQFTDGREARFARILVAIGRQPHTSGLDAAAAGIALDEQGFIRTNEYLETSQPGIYAVGDVKAGPMTANAALHDAKVAVTNALEGNRVTRNYYRVPIVIDSALEIAAVGLTEDRAEEAGFEPEVARANFAASAKSLGRNDYEGFIEVVHDDETGQMLGGCIVGPEAGEQIQLLTAACQSPRGLWFLKDLSYSHPSWCEELENAIDPYAADFVQSGREVFRPGIYAINE